MSKALVVGASGFLGSHVVKALVARGRDVRILVRPTSNLAALEGLEVETFHGDVMDATSLSVAMHGCDTVFYCVVDTRSWLSDPTPLYETNVGGLINAMDAALAADVGRFIFTSSLVTIGLKPDGMVTEDDAFNWADIAPDYVLCRVEAENTLMQYCREKNFPGIAMCVANTYGPDDLQPTPHGNVVRNVALGKMPVALKCANPVVDIRDAADALLLAAEKGGIGERYIVATEQLGQVEMFAMAANFAGVKPPAINMPLWIAYTIGWINEKIAGVSGRSPTLRVSSVRLSHIYNAMDNGKARRELGWNPRPMSESIRDAVESYLAVANQP